MNFVSKSKVPSRCRSHRPIPPPSPPSYLLAISKPVKWMNVKQPGFYLSRSSFALFISLPLTHVKSLHVYSLSPNNKYVNFTFTFISRRGKPLFLSQERFKRLEEQWFTHSFDHTCKRWKRHLNTL